LPDHEVGAFHNPNVKDHREPVPLTPGC
jgi:hypothetical protein